MTQDAFKEMQCQQSSIFLLGSRRRTKSESHLRNEQFRSLWHLVVCPRQTGPSSSMSAPDCGPSSDEHPSVTVIHDHPYDVKKSPSKLKRELDDALQVVSKFKKKLKVSQMKTSCLNKKVDSLISVVESLKENHLVSNACADVLETTFAGASRDLMKRIVSQKANKKPGASTAELRSFAMTLKFYSAKAYKYVRNTFDLGLPHPSTIRTWYGAVNADPGFTKAAFSALSAKVLAAKRDGQDIICSLMLDEMAIRKHVDWDGEKFRGYVDIGTGVVDDVVWLMHWIIAMSN